MQCTCTCVTVALCFQYAKVCDHFIGSALNDWDCILRQPFLHRSCQFYWLVTSESFLLLCFDLMQTATPKSRTPTPKIESTSQELPGDSPAGSGTRGSTVSPAISDGQSVKYNTGDISANDSAHTSDALDLAGALTGWPEIKDHMMMETGENPSCDENQEGEQLCSRNFHKVHVITSWAWARSWQCVSFLIIGGDSIMSEIIARVSSKWNIVFHTTGTLLQFNNFLISLVSSSCHCCCIQYTWSALESKRSQRCCFEFAKQRLPAA